MTEIRTYEIRLPGFSAVRYNGRTPGSARAAAWRDYSRAFDCTFKRFLTISAIKRVPNPPDVGRRILVAGNPATTCISHGQYIRYIRNGEDCIFSSHPFDVVFLVPDGAGSVVSPTMSEKQPD